MMTVFWPSGTSRVTPSRTRRAPNDFVRPSSWITRRRSEGRKDGTTEGPGSKALVRSAMHRRGGRVVPLVRPSVAPSSQQYQRPERVQDQDRLAAEHDRAGSGLPDALRAALGIQPAQAAHERHRGAEARALHQPEPDVLEPVEQLEALEELGRR